MPEEAIIHVSRSDHARSSRVQYQLSCDGGTHIDGTRFLDYAAIRRILRNPRVKQVVFHQHACLGNLALALLLRRLYRRKIAVVFDIHDLLEFRKEFMTVKKLVLYFVTVVLQRLAVTSDVSFMTVSPEIADLIEQKYEIKVETVLNMAPRTKRREASGRADRKRIVYFGHITNERLNGKYLRPFFEAGFSLDVFGVFGNSFTEQDMKKLAPNPDQINYLGKYNGQDITALVSDYCASWIVVESSYTNIHFCLPNKLFQSLSVGTPCIVHSEMVSSRKLTDVGLKVYLSEEFLSLEYVPRSSIEVYDQYERQNAKRYLDFLARSAG